MATVTTTTVGNPLIYPSQSSIERGVDGALYVMVAASTANTYELWRSTNSGGSWSLALSTVRANVQEVGVIHTLRNPYNQMVWMYRVYEGGNDVVYFRSILDLGATLAWTGETAIASVAAASAGAILTGFDMQTVVANGLVYVIAGIGIQSGSVQGAHFNVASGPGLNNIRQTNNLWTGTRQWTPTTTSGRVTPSIDLEHSGDGHAAQTPHLWMAWGRTQAYAVKASWTGNGWSGPAAAVQLNPVTLTPAQDSIAARWDGQRFSVVVPDPTSTSVVTVFERNRSNSTTTIRQTPTHPQGVVRNCALGWNSVTGDIRVFAVGTSTSQLYFVDYVRASGTWSSWATVTATAILGANANNYSVRRATNGRYEVATAHSGSPNTIVHTSQSLSYTPNAPVWDTGAMQLQSGGSYDVNTPLTLDWVFSDPDPADTQSAYAVSRQIGAGALSYWRASDSTWQPAEVQNTSGTSAITLPAPWGSGSDAVTTFKAKVWDATSTPSAYGDGFTVLPSTVVNPAITAPTAAQVLTADSVAVTWTASEQQAYRLRLHTMLLGDAFGRTVGAGGVGSADYGGVYTINGGTGTDYSVSGGLMRMAQTSVTNREARISPPVIPADLDVVLGPFAINQTPTGNSVESAFRCRYTDANNYVAFRWFYLTSNTLTVNIDSRIGGVSTNSTFFTVSGITAATAVYVHARAVGDQLMIRAWPSTAAEPVNLWHATLTATQFQAGTMFGLNSGVNSGNTNAGLVSTWDAVFVRAADPTYDSGWTSSVDLRTVTPPVRLPDLSAWTVGLTTRNAEGLAGTEQVVGFTIDYVEPAAATLVATPDPTNGVISVAITNPSPVGSQPAVASQDVYARTNQGANLLPNPGFEVNTTGWAGNNGATLTRSTAQFHTGTAAGLLTPDGVSALPRVETPSGSLFTVAEGQTWTVDGWFRATTANKPISIAINWYDVTPTFVTSSVLQVNPIASAWLYLSATFTVPIGVSVVRAGVRAAVHNTPAAGDTLHIDDMRLRQATADPGVRVGVALASGATLADWHAVSGTDYEYRVLTRGANGTSTYGPWTA